MYPQQQYPVGTSGYTGGYSAAGVANVYSTQQPGQVPEQTQEYHAGGVQPLRQNVQSGSFADASFGQLNAQVAQRHMGGLNSALRQGTGGLSGVDSSSGSLMNMMSGGYGGTSAPGGAHKPVGVTDPSLSLSSRLINSQGTVRQSSQQVPNRQPGVFPDPSVQASLPGGGVLTSSGNGSGNGRGYLYGDVGQRIPAGPVPGTTSVSTSGSRPPTAAQVSGVGSSQDSVMLPASHAMASFHPQQSVSNQQGYVAPRSNMPSGSLFGESLGEPDAVSAPSSVAELAGELSAGALPYVPAPGGFGGVSAPGCGTSLGWSNDGDLNSLSSALLSSSGNTGASDSSASLLGGLLGGIVGESSGTTKSDDSQVTGGMPMSLYDSLLAGDNVSPPS